MGKKDKPFGIRKAPVEIITAQAIPLDYVKLSEKDGEGFGRCQTISIDRWL